MRLLSTFSIAACVVAGATTGASAIPLDVPLPAPASVTPVVYGYGPLPYGLYGHRRHYRSRRSYGTGYHGRGTRTGGPAGGLPSRN